MQDLQEQNLLQKIYLPANPFQMFQGLATVFVTEPNHGRSTNDTS